MDGLVVNCGARSAGSHSYRLVQRRAKRRTVLRRLYRNAIGSISLLALLLKGNFRGPQPHAFWRNATDRADPPPTRVVKVRLPCQKNDPSGTPLNVAGAAFIDRN